MIVHLTTQTDWQTAQPIGTYRAASLETEGFIHCSTTAQILDVANLFYAGIPDLVLLWIELSRVRADVRWEPPVHPGSSPSGKELENQVQLFPHIYGPLNLDAVVEVTDFVPDVDGVFRRVRG
ncbi:MAG: DUF952 domain-containing protein [Anaerolineales bacterium]